MDFSFGRSVFFKVGVCKAHVVRFPVPRAIGNISGTSVTSVDCMPDEVYDGCCRWLMLVRSWERHCNWVNLLCVRRVSQSRKMPTQRPYQHSRLNRLICNFAVPEQLRQMFCCILSSTGLGLYTRLQNGVDRVSRLVRVNEPLDITNHRGACQPRAPQ